MQSVGGPSRPGGGWPPRGMVLETERISKLLRQRANTCQLAAAGVRVLAGEGKHDEGLSQQMGALPDEGAGREVWAPPPRRPPGSRPTEHQPWATIRQGAAQTT
jgi:hypothetical protein